VRGWARLIEWRTHARWRDRWRAVRALAKVPLLALREAYRDVRGFGAGVAAWLSLLYS
jgi:hypothetical protein